MQTSSTLQIRMFHQLAAVCRRCSSLLLAGCCLVAALSGCSLTIHPGSSELAFLRSGTIWVMQPDGSNARSLTSGDIVSLAWSPDHHQLLYRLLSAGAVFPTPAPTNSVPDAASAIAVIGINGGYPLILTRDNDTAARSDPWWNPVGNRLVYRQEYSASPNALTYVVSQSDQPAGIASKPLLNAASLPAISSDGHQVAVADSSGSLRLGAPGSQGTILAQATLLTLPGAVRPAHILWQPQHSSLLYPTAGPGGGVKLVLIGLDGRARWSVSLPALLDAAFSPDGSLLLVRTPNQFEVFAVGNSQELYSWADSDTSALPWWAPDSDRLVVLDQTGLTLVDVRRHVVKPLATFRDTAVSQLRSTPGQWHPATSDPWSADGSQLVFAGGTGDTWQGGAKLPVPHSSNRGLYVVSLHADSPGFPSLIDSGNDSLPTWSYPDPSTTFLIGA